MRSTMMAASVMCCARGVLRSYRSGRLECLPADDIGVPAGKLGHGLVGRLPGAFGGHGWRVARWQHGAVVQGAHGVVRLGSLLRQCRSAQQQQRGCPVPRRTGAGA